MGMRRRTTPLCNGCSRKFAWVCMLLFALLLMACGTETSILHGTYEVKTTNAPVEMPTATSADAELDCYNQDNVPENELWSLDVGIFPSHPDDELMYGFATVLNAYAEFERSGFTVLDGDLIAQSHFAAPQLSWATTYLGVRPRVMYAFHDMNGSGVPELFIGGVWGHFNGYPSLITVYALQDGIPTPVIYELSNNSFLNLFTDVYGNYFIRNAGGRHGIFWDTAHGIDENGDLLFLGGVYSWIRWRLCECCNMYDSYFVEFYRVYGAGISAYDVLISEDEYTVFLVQWGMYNNKGLVELAWEYIVRDN